MLMRSRMTKNQEKEQVIEKIARSFVRDPIDETATALPKILWNYSSS